MLTATFDAFEATQTVQINVGDVVTLKTGGSRMTVTYVGPVARRTGDWLVCQWFDEHGELRQETFAQDDVWRQPRSIPAGSVHLHKFVRTVSP
ncbi:YodC family protein [Paraburkholderia sp. LEh10]|uniref:YodC family protein n=1 Tax=Paraburkholderia sp. LEh10 TaxID=2821353 RepID=UPI001AE724E8|nr:YodC family protein [Paraburkholderia sp. LEh10]MBP0589982.1 YodC family protein [Paraburkholderia sp. LEh10]